jgi:hypothetical protein
MTLYLTIYQSDSGRPLADGFRTEPEPSFRWDQDRASHESEAAELEARLILLVEAMESLGYEVSFTVEAPPAGSTPRMGFHVIE